MNHHTFLLTISTKDDVSAPTEGKLIKYLTKNFDHAYGVAERDRSGIRHLHFALCSALPRQSSNIHDDVWKRHVRPHHGDSIGRYAVVVTVMYNHDWHTSYLRKEEGCEVLIDRYDPDLVSTFFPTPEQQEKLIQTKGKRIADTYVHSLSAAFQEFTEECSPGSALDYLRTRMFITHDMAVILDERRLRQLALALYRYRSNDIRRSLDDDHWLANSCPTEPLFLANQPPGSTGNTKKMYAGKLSFTAPSTI